MLGLDARPQRLVTVTRQRSGLAVIDCSHHVVPLGLKRCNARLRMARTSMMYIAFILLHSVATAAY